MRVITLYVIGSLMSLILGMASANSTSVTMKLVQHPGDSKQTVECVVNAKDYPSLQNAVDALPDGGGEIILPPGNYLLDKPLDLTGRNTRPKSDKYPRSGDFIKLKGSGIMTTVLQGTMRNQPVVDMTDSAFVTMKDLQIRSDTANIGLLLARGEDNASVHGVFENVMIDGKYSIANVYSYVSEECRWQNCRFSNSEPDASCFIITPMNYWKVTSLYEKLSTGCSNTEFRFYGCQFNQWGGGKGVGLRVCGPSTSDISIFGGYCSSTGLAAVLLDGTYGGGSVSNIIIDGVRIEAERAEHCLLARGNTENVDIRNGQWISGSGEPILYESGGNASSWHMQSMNFIVYDNLYVEYKSNSSEYCMTHFLSPLRNSDLTITNCVFARFVPDEKGEKNASYLSGKALVCDEDAPGSHFIVQRRSDIEIKGTGSSIVTALSDDGVMRTYQGTGGVPALLNLTPCLTQKVPNPKLGDIALDDGTNTADHKPCPMFYDGSRWRAFNLEP